MKSKIFHTAKSVNPQKWTNKIVLADVGYYSVVWGNYDKSELRVMGVRWNGNSIKSGEPDCDQGYPCTFGKPQFHVEPHIFNEVIINKCLQLNFDLWKEKKLSDIEYADLKSNCILALEEWFDK